MKKISILAMLLGSFTSSTTVLAKGENIKDYKISLFGGFGINSLKNVATKVDNYDITKEKNKVGYLFGINAEKKLTDRYFFNIGLGVDQRGGGSSAVITDTNLVPNDYVRRADVMYNTQYLTMPIGLKMIATEVSDFKIFALAGAELGVVISQKGESTIIAKNGVVQPASGGKLKGYANTTPANVSWSIGAGTEYPVSKTNSAYFIMQYRNGLIDATLPKTNNNGFKFSDGNVRSNSFTFRVGYVF
jgi:hypothetical protein